MFLLSTTHGAETPVAGRRASRTMAIYKSEPVVEHLHRQGERLADGRSRQAARRHGLDKHVDVDRPAVQPAVRHPRRRTATRRSRSGPCSCRR